MAADWFQVDCDLPEKREVVNIVSRSGEPVDVVIGRLMLLWRWVDRHFSGPKLKGSNAQTLTQVARGDEKFWKIVSDEGWLVFKDDGIVIPKWRQRFSKSAKARLLDARRKANKRNKNVRHRPDKKRTRPGAKEEPTVGTVGNHRNKKPIGCGRGLVSVTAEILRDTSKLLEWVELESKRKRARVTNSEHDQLRVVAAAERALEKGDKPVALFVDLITKGRWKNISQDQEDRASQRLREFRATLGPANGHAVELGATFSANKDSD